METDIFRAVRTFRPRTIRPKKVLVQKYYLAVY